MKIEVLLICLFFAVTASAQTNPEPTPSDKILLTVILRHDQSKSLEELQKIQEEQGFAKTFPPPGTRIVTWHVAMGIGQIIALEVPAAQLRAVNLAIEKSAWKAFRTEFYPTYDLYPFIKDKLTNSLKVTD